MRDERAPYHWLMAAVWLSALFVLCVALVCTNPIQAELQKVVPPLWRTPLPTPELIWPTPLPTNTPRPIPTSMPTPTLRPLHLRPWEIDAVAALVAYEALSESLRGQTAVAYVLLHRSLHIGKPPTKILTRKFFGSEVGAEHLAEMQDWWKPDNPEIGFDLWQQITLVAINTVNGWSYDEFPTSTHFCSTCILEELPAWTTDLELLGCIGCHCFYGPKGG